MIVLGIETATPVCSVGLVRDQDVLAEVSEDAGRRHSVVLVDMIDRALEDVPLSRDKIEGVAISAGPGSFTGLRIGMGLAKGICLASDIPLAVVSTLEGLVAASGVTDTMICGCLDARHDELYSGVYQSGSSGMCSVQADEARSVQDLIAKLGPDTVVVGYDIEPYEQRFLDVGLTVRPSVVPSGAAVAYQGHQKLRAGQATPIDQAVPNYCKKSQAERLREGIST